MKWRKEKGVREDEQTEKRNRERKNIESEREKYIRYRVPFSQDDNEQRTNKKRRMRKNEI